MRRRNALKEQPFFVKLVVIEEKKKGRRAKERKNVTAGSYFFLLFAHGANVGDGSCGCLNSSTNTRATAVARGVMRL